MTEKGTRLSSEGGGKVRFQGLPLSATSTKTLNPHYSHRISRLKKVLMGGACLLGLLILVWPNVHFIEDPFLKDPSLWDHPKTLPSGMKQMSKASLRALTQKGQPYTVQSESATQTSSEQFIFEKPLATLFLKEGGTVQLASQRGEGHKDQKTIELKDNVHIHQANGYHLQTQKAIFDLKEGDAHGQDPVQGTGPLGHIEAGGFQTQNQGEVILFKEGVHLSFSSSPLT